MTSTEPYQFVTNRNLSPFNVGESIGLLDFTPEQVAELNQRHGAPLDVDTAQRLFDLIGGDPFLVRRALYLVASGRLTADELFTQAIEDHGPFGDHLCRHLFRLHEDRELLESLRQVLARQTCADERTFFRLHGAGLVRRDGRAVVTVAAVCSVFWRTSAWLSSTSILWAVRCRPVAACTSHARLIPSCWSCVRQAHLPTSCRHAKWGSGEPMVRTSEQLMATGTHAVVVDLSNLGTQLTAEAWYLGLLTTIADSLMLSTDVVAWWQAHAHLGQAQRLTDFFQEVLLTETEAPVVIFIDEIDSTLSLPFTDDFYAAIRSVYNARALVPAFRRLSFVLLGVATPSDLISDPRRTPFNIGQRVEVTDFTYEEALPLADGFGLSPTQAQQVLRWVLDWTGGHPYLTQRLCRVMADEDRAAVVRNRCGADGGPHLFRGNRANRITICNLSVTCSRNDAPEPVRVLATYRTIRQGRRAVRDEEQSLVLAHLKLSGVVRQVQRVLRVRNRIYETVFDLPWVREHWPVPWYRRVPPVAWGLLASLMAVVLLLGLLVANTAAHVRRYKRSQSARRKPGKKPRRASRKQRRHAPKRSAYVCVSLAQALAAQAPREQEVAYQDERAALLARQAYLFNQRGQGEVLDHIDDALRAVLSRPYFQRVLHGHRGGVVAVAFSLDGTTLASASDDRTVRLWDLQTPEAAPRVLHGHEGGVRAAAFSPDGTTLALASGDYTVRLWDLRTPEVAPACCVAMRAG